MTRYLGIVSKLKSILPLKVRIQIFQSFIQSYLTYYPLVWGFSAKSHTHFLFIEQKQGIRSVMPGYANYLYKEVKLPAHTRETFKDYNILTVHGIIFTNAPIFIHKLRHFPNSLPPSMCSLIPETNSKFGDSISDCSEWVEN